MPFCHGDPGEIGQNFLSAERIRAASSLIPGRNPTRLDKRVEQQPNRYSLAHLQL
jgi:hypothetical protein